MTPRHAHKKLSLAEKRNPLICIVCYNEQRLSDEAVSMKNRNDIIQRRNLEMDEMATVSKNPTQHETFEWPGRGRAEPKHQRFGETRHTWITSDGAKLVRYHETAWQAQRKSCTTRLRISAALAMEELERLENEK